MKKKKLCIIHIGMPKTGSTALQETLSTRIADHEIGYSSLPYENHSRVMVNMFSQHQKQFYDNNRFAVPYLVGKYKKIMVKDFTAPSKTTHILSGENMIYMDNKALTGMKHFLNDFFEKIIVVGYIRPPVSFMASAFQELVKIGIVSSFDFEFIYPHYRFKLDKFDAVFGRKNVNLWKFSPQNFPDNDVVKHFCIKLNITLDPSDVVNRANKSLSKEAISLLFFDNKYGDQESVSYNRTSFVDFFRTIGASKFNFSRSLMQEVCDENKDDITWVENRIEEPMLDLEKSAETGVSKDNELFDLALSDVVFKQLQIVLDQHQISAGSGQFKKSEMLNTMLNIKNHFKYNRICKFIKTLIKNIYIN